MAQTLGNAADYARLSGSSGPPLVFGDGTPMPLEPIKRAHELSEAAAVNLQWEKGDCALLDNRLVMHARRPWQGDGPRRVLASLVL